MSYPKEAGMNHQQAYELLPWWVNGTLSAEQQAQVDDHVKSCSTCQQEILLISTFNESLEAEAHRSYADHADADASLGSVMRLIDDESDSSERTQTLDTSDQRHSMPASNTRLRHRVGNSLKSLFDLPFNIQWGASLLAGMLVIGVGFWVMNEQRLGDYSVLSSSEELPGATQLTLMFSPSASDAEVRQIIHEQSALFDQAVEIQRLDTGYYLVTFTNPVELLDLSQLTASFEAMDEVEQVGLK